MTYQNIPSFAPADLAAFIDYFQNVYIPQVLVPADVRNANAGSGIVITPSDSTSQPPTIEADVTTIVTQPVIVTALSGDLDQERELAIEGPLTLTDGGANSTITISTSMATASFLGRQTAGTGVAEVLSATEATALLDEMTGDSGSGGVKGLVPAPGTGDAAANKFLKADGTFAAIQDAASGVRGLVKLADAVADAADTTANITASDATDAGASYDQTVAQSNVDLSNDLKAQLTQLITDFGTLATTVQDIQSALRSAGIQAT